MLVLSFFVLRTGDRRFRLPEAISSYTTSFSATKFGPACPQQPVDVPSLESLGPFAATVGNFIANSIFKIILEDDEDCKLPFLFSSIKSNIFG